MPPRARPLLLLLSLAGVVVAAVYLTPPVYRLLLDAGWIREDQFLKVLRRLLLIPLLLVLFAWLRPWRDGGPRSYGLLGPAASLRIFGSAYQATLATGLTILAIHYATGWLAFEDPLDVSKGLRRAVRWIPIGLVLAVIEEWFFRGWLDRRFGRRLSPAWTATVGAGIYAAVHAFKPSRLDVEITHDAAGAWNGLGWWLEHLVDPERFGPMFVGLFLFGILLTLLWRRTGTLWAPIGVHAAGIALLRTYGAFTDRVPPKTWAGSKELLDGPPVWILLVIAILWITRHPAADVPDPGSSQTEGRIGA